MVWDGGRGHRLLFFRKFYLPLSKILNIIKGKIHQFFTRTHTQEIVKFESEPLKHVKILQYDLSIEYIQCISYWAAIQFVECNV